MGLFKTKAKPQEEVLDPKMKDHIFVMPESFHSKPLVEKKEVREETPPPPVQPIVQKPTEPPKMPVTPGQKPTVPFGVPPSKMKAWIKVLIILASVIIVGLGLFLVFYRPTSAPTVNRQAAVNRITPPVEQVEQPVVNIITPPAPTPVPGPILPDILPSTLDSDGDGLTDVEEAAYSTDLTIPDIDEDGFPDGTEVMNLYNPTGFAPVRIIDSGLVEVFSNEDYFYEIYYPTGWEARTLLEAPQEVIITPQDQVGEFFNVFVIENPDRLALVSWYIREVVPGVTPATIQRITNRRGQLDGILALDEQTAYFEVGDRIYAVHYNSGTLEQLNFKSTFILMYESFVASPPTDGIFPEDTLEESVDAPADSEEETPSDDQQEEEGLPEGGE